MVAMVRFSLPGLRNMAPAPEGLLAGRQEVWQPKVDERFTRHPKIALFSVIFVNKKGTS
jgi:hypothetical protein